MNYKLFFTILIFTLGSLKITSQNFPWERPLQMAWSKDGKTFDKPEIFQDSSGVPSVIKWKGDTLICAFQWFRQPRNSSSWDRVAVKFSYDSGLTWTQPTPIVVTGFPINFQRPFDPTLTAFGNDSIRIYFSSSDGLPKMGLDSMINTYSAASLDGIHFTFEPGARVDEPSNRVIDPAVIYFRKSWHYIAPIGSPQQGAYHYVSPNGINFSSVPNIPSDNMHNWTGNFMVPDTNQLRFYGSGPFIWYNSSPNGGIWNGFVNTNIQGGDPSVAKIADSSYLMIFVGNPYPTDVHNNLPLESLIQINTNPVGSSISFFHLPADHQINYQIFSSTGVLVASGRITDPFINVAHLSKGQYFLVLKTVSPPEKIMALKFVKE